MPNLTSIPAFELKGSLTTLMVLHLFKSDQEAITVQLADKVAQAPQFFQHAPLLIDLQDLGEPHLSALDLTHLVELLRKHGLVPVAIRGGTDPQKQLALNLTLGILPQNSRSESREKPQIEVESEPVILNTSAKIISHPVRSGQQVVALQGDLVVLSPVSHGAEILAHGHIHVYSALRGRALAGVNGDTQARIFCQQLEAELVSIAGQYQINEGLPHHLQGKAAQIFLVGEELKIEAL